MGYGLSLWVSSDGSIDFRFVAESRKAALLPQYEIKKFIGSLEINSRKVDSKGLSAVYV